MKCPACGFMQMASPTCKACGTPLGGPASDPRPLQHQEPEVQIGSMGPQRPARKFKKLFGILAVGLLVIGAWGAIGFGLVKFWRHGSQLDAGSKAYVDEVVPKIVASWNSKDLTDRASPELLATASPERIEKVFRAFSDRLGHLRSYGGSRGQATVWVTPQTGKVSTASYVAEATFEKGKASVQVNLVAHDGTWKISGFYVNSDALIP